MIKQNDIVDRTIVNMIKRKPGYHHMSDRDYKMEYDKAYADRFGHEKK